MAWEKEIERVRGKKTVIKKGEDCRVQEKNKREDIK